MRMPSAPLWHARADGRGRSIDPAATVAFGPGIPRITGPSVAANRSIRRRDHGHAQAVIVFREAGVALVVVTADSGICRGDDHGAGIAVPPETRIARPVTTSNHRIGRRPYGNTVTTLLPVSGIAGPALAAKRGIGGNHFSQAGVFDPVPSEVAVPVVAPHISVCRHDKRDAAVALEGKSAGWRLKRHIQTGVNMFRPKMSPAIIPVKVGAALITACRPDS